MAVGVAPVIQSAAMAVFIAQSANICHRINTYASVLAIYIKTGL
jgi:hypothetical protein